MESDFIDDYAAMEEYTDGPMDDYEMMMVDNECPQAACDNTPPNKEGGKRRCSDSMTQTHASVQKKWGSV